MGRGAIFEAGAPRPHSPATYRQASSVDLPVDSLLKNTLFHCGWLVVVCFRTPTYLFGFLEKQRFQEEMNDVHGS